MTDINPAPDDLVPVGEVVEKLLNELEKGAADDWWCKPRRTEKPE